MNASRNARRWEDIQRQRVVMAQAQVVLARAEERLRRSREVLDDSVAIGLARRAVGEVRLDHAVALPVGFDLLGVPSGDEIRRNR